MTTKRPSIVWSMDDGKVVVDLDKPARPFGVPAERVSRRSDDVVSRPPTNPVASDATSDVETDEGDPVSEVLTEDDGAPET